MLLDLTADINPREVTAKGEKYGDELHTASTQGLREAVKMLLDGGAAIND